MPKTQKKQNNLKQVNQKKEKSLEGIALGDCKDKTVRILVDNIKVHSVYKKRYRDSKKYLVSCDQEIKKGQKVIITETRPVSKRKSWKILKENK